PVKPERRDRALRSREKHGTMGSGSPGRQITIILLSPEEILWEAHVYVLSSSRHRLFSRRFSACPRSYLRRARPKPVTTPNRGFAPKCWSRLIGWRNTSTTETSW